MARKYTRLEKRRYREKRRAQAARVADRLLGKRKKIIDPDVESFFGGSQMQVPIQYQNSTNFYNKNIRPALIPWEIVNEVK